MNFLALDTVCDSRDPQCPLAASQRPTTNPHTPAAPQDMPKKKTEREAKAAAKAAAKADATAAPTPAAPTPAAPTPAAPAKPMSPTVKVLGNVLLAAAFVACLAYCGYHAWDIRMYAIRTYGLVIHEFDPWFNFRATIYLRDHGLYEFFHWFDYMSWYPLGRPVGTTIYPGMQMTSVFIWKVLNDYVGYEISLNDVCCYVPTWGGVCATVFLALLARECTGSWASGVAAASIMSIVPAHIMRSVGGGYDNESIALTAMCMTFFLWCRALRADPKAQDGVATRDSYVYGVLSGLAYVYMAAAWGGFIFVINMIAFHAGALFFLGRYSSKLHRAYSLFYVVGTLGAMQIPVVGWRPLQSLEQLGGLVVFLAFQVLEYCEVERRKRALDFIQVFVLRVKVTLPALLCAFAVVTFLNSTGYFGPLGARIRGLFVKHTRTGNPLVDSVAEHQPASEAAYKQYLHHVFHVVPYGFALALARLPLGTDANAFLVAYAMVAYYFANKMARLIILLGPISSALGGAAMGFVFDQTVMYGAKHLLAPVVGEDPDDAVQDETEESQDNPKRSYIQNLNTKLATLSFIKQTRAQWRSPMVCAIRVACGIAAVQWARPYAKEFFDYSHQMAEGMSGPSIMFKAKLRNGESIIVDDYREAYWWLRDKTPEDSRVMAWWDYGYQITGIGNRTTIADGNTWNHEHIATLGRILSAPEKRAHKIARHLADYVLVWAGGGGDDLAKSPHMARIGNSVYHDICHEPTCSEFGFYRGGIPTPMMRKSLLYKLTQFGYKPDVKVNPKRFEHVFTSKYGKVRIFKIVGVSKKSKRWIANPANRVCDAPGSWYCSGQYPPALHKLIAKRKNFRQLEDFNVGQDKESEQYQKEYHKRMSGGHPLNKGHSGEKPDRKTKKAKAKRKPRSKHAPATGEDLNLKYVGCVGRESELGDDKEYGGGDSGANVYLARSLAWDKGAKYVAIARHGVDGHSFTFNKKLKKKPKLSDKGCAVPCADHEGYKCGCADGACQGLGPVPGEEHTRRWVVYAVGPKPEVPEDEEDDGNYRGEDVDDDDE